jgi:hypothetical protein
VEKLMKKNKHVAGWGRTTFAWMVACTGTLWLTGWVMYGLPVSELLEMTDLQATLRRTSGVMHGVVTWAFCVMCGRGVWPHVRMMWSKQNERAQWWWGIFQLVWLVCLAIGGLVLLYGSPPWHEAMSPVHFWLGATLPLIFLAHTWRRFIR